MPPADGRNLGGNKVKFYYTKAPPSAITDKIKEDPPATPAGEIKKLTIPANELKGVDEPGEYGRDTESTTEQPYGNPSFNVLGSTTLTDVDVTYMPDMALPLDAQFAAQDSLGTQVLFIEELTGNTPANKTYNVVLGNLGGVRRVANKNGAQRYRRRIVVSAIQMGIPGE